MAKSPAIRIAPDLLPSESTVEVENVRDVMRAYDAMPDPVTSETAAGIRHFLGQTSSDGTPRVLLVARELDKKRRQLSGLVLGALYGLGPDGRKTLLVDFLVGNYDLLEPVVARLRGVALVANLRSQAQVVGALVPSHDVLRAAGFTSYPWQGHEVMQLEAA